MNKEQIKKELIKYYEFKHKKPITDFELININIYLQSIETEQESEETEEKPIYTEAVGDNYATILKDGKEVTITEILNELNQ